VNIHVRPELASGIVGGVVGLVLVVVPAAQSHAAAARAAGRYQATLPIMPNGQRAPYPNSGQDGMGNLAPGWTPASPSAAPVCDLPAAVSSTDAATTAAAWAALYLSGPSEACHPAGRRGLDAAASGEQVADDKWAAPELAAHVTGPVVVSRSKGGLLSNPGDYRADVPTDSAANVVEGGNLRLRMAQNAAGLWQVTSASFSSLVLGPDGQPF
jgi:hypothetical protein